ncbi:hypothetical protein QT381_04475 [Galbitalea sp. SE-J8]|uniref:hypothetical protein n=1 Tax=Galbitalea sp. SE-J8 TaxID=3054952 RepID=UPI00259C9288|nr:hypothetical protein [Galbitalea sp. SE-J8]MDM4762260.1 hypothetical protein [Galbitalea sp. SE-J8]
MTTLALTAVALGSGAAAEVPPTTLGAVDGAVTVVAVETDERPMLLSLLAAGRMTPTAGTVAIDGRTDAAHLRRAVALVDTPFVAEPVPGVALATIVREELSFAARPTSRSAVDAELARHGLGEHRTVPIRALDTADRIRLLAELALLRPAVRALVLTSPERHGGDPGDWFAALAAIAERGHVVLVVTDAPTRDRLIRLGAVPATAQPSSAQPSNQESSK